MLPQSFIDYHSAREKHIRSHYEQLREYPTVDSVHDFRVEVKRLWAFYGLVGWINKSFNAKKYLKQTRRMFKAADKLRDVHVHQDLTRAWAKENSGNLSEYYNFLASEQWRREVRFARLCRQYDTETLTKGFGRVREALSEISETDWLCRAESRLAVLARELSKISSDHSMSERTLHKIRIKAKETRYVLEVIRLGRPPTERDAALNESLRASHRALGQWHDRTVGLEKLTRFLEDRKRKYFFDFQSYSRFRASLAEERDQFLTSFAHLWNELESVLNDYAQDKEDSL